MKLYFDPVTVNCRKVLAGLDLIGAAYSDEKVDYFGGGHTSPEYTAINPNQSLPTLVDDGFTVWESNAILQYAADKHGNDAVYPKDLRTRTDVNRWLLWESNQWFPACYIWLVENVVKPILGDKPDEKILADATPKFHQLAGIIDSAVEKQPWLCGQDVTIADIAVAAPMHLHPWQKLPLDDYPNLVSWMKRVEALPSWKKTDPVPLLGLK
jgi:glutathione S-transferase